MTRSAEAPVVVAGLVRRYEGVTAVDGISFRVERGEMFGLIGPDGAGKTTTLRAILGLLAVDAGTIRTCGLDPRARSKELAGRVGYLSQRFSLYGDLTVAENVAFFAAAHAVRKWRPRRDELLESLRLAPFRSRLADRLSGGMKQKLALACTLIHDPELLVLDEPTTGVDPVSRRELWRILERLRGEGLTLLMTTPYLDEAERCQRVALMHLGKLLTVDAPESIRARHPGTIFEVIATPRQQAAAILRTSEDRARVVAVQTFGERLHVTLAEVTSGGADAAGSRLRERLVAAGIAVESLRPIAPSLEDVFIERMGAPEAVA